MSARCPTVARQVLRRVDKARADAGPALVRHDGDRAKQGGSVVRLDGRAADEAIAIAGDDAGRERLGRAVERQAGLGRARSRTERPVAGRGARSSPSAAARAAAAAAGLGDREQVALRREVDERSGVGGLRRLDDRADHPLGDRVRRRDRDVGQPDRLQPVAELRDRQRAGDAAGVRAALGALLGAQRVLGDDVADADPAAGPEDAGDLARRRRACRRRG